MGLEKTEGIILKTMLFQETSKIVSLFTREFGKLSVIAKGVRKTDAKYGSVLDVLNAVSVLFYYKKSGGLHLLKESDVVDSFRRIKDDLEKTAAAYAAIEILNSAVIEEEPHLELYLLAFEVLQALNTTLKNPKNIYWYFALRLLDITGYPIYFVRCRQCGEEIKGGRIGFSIENGGSFCEKCLGKRGTGIEISPESFRILSRVREMPLQSVCNLVPSKRSGDEINEIIHRYMRYHIEGFRAPNAFGLINNINNNT